MEEDSATRSSALRPSSSPAPTPAPAPAPTPAPVEAEDPIGHSTDDSAGTTGVPAVPPPPSSSLLPVPSPQTSEPEEGTVEEAKEAKEEKNEKAEAAPVEASDSVASPSGAETQSGTLPEQEEELPEDPEHPEEEEKEEDEDGLQRSHDGALQQSPLQGTTPPPTESSSSEKKLVPAKEYSLASADKEGQAPSPEISTAPSTDGDNDLDNDLDNHIDDDNNNNNKNNKNNNEGGGDVDESPAPAPAPPQSPSSPPHITSIDALEAALERLDDNLVAAYRLARARCSNSSSSSENEEVGGPAADASDVWEEVDPFAFLRRHHNGDSTDDSDDAAPAAAVAAARAFAKHWEGRRTILGDDRFHLPLDATGEGVLQSNDVRLFETGLAFVLPPSADQHTSSDSDSATAVLCFDFEALEENGLSPEAAVAARVCWYASHVAAFSEFERVVVLLLLPSSINPTTEEAETVTQPRWMDPLRQVFQYFPLPHPVEVHAVLVSPSDDAEHPDEPASNEEGEDPELRALSQSLRSLLGEGVDDNAKNNNGDDTGGVVAVHRCRAYPNAPPPSIQHLPNLPAKVGGKYTDDDFQLWRLTRVAFERARRANRRGSPPRHRPPSSSNHHHHHHHDKTKSSSNAGNPNPKRGRPASSPHSGSPASAKKRAKHGVPVPSTSRGWSGPSHSTSDPHPPNPPPPGHDAGLCRRADITQAAEALPLDDILKQPYLEAQDRVPELVAKETDPQGFLRIADGDVERAATLLVQHWNKRQTLFGPRALLPLTQTGEGALNRGDLTALSSGVIVILPNDRLGRSVVFYDCSKAADSHRDALRRVAFYMLTVASEVSAAPNRGIVLVIGLDDGQAGGQGLAAAGAAAAAATTTKGSLADLLEVIPSTIEAVHVVCFPVLSRDPDVPRAQFEQTARSAVGTSTVPDGRLYVHMDRSRSEALEKLYKYHLTAACLPKSVGGNWGIERFVEWCELRTRYEWDLPPAASHKGIDKIFDFSHMKPPSHLEESDKIERARRMNVLHSRRKRERERIEIEVLHEQVDELRAKNRELTVEGHRLTSHLRSAEMVLLQPSHPEDAPMHPSTSMSNSPYLAPPMDATGAGTAADPMMVSADSTAAYMPMPMATPSMPPQMMYQTYNHPTFAPQAFAPQGQVFVTAAPPGPQYCIMPSGYFQPQMQAPPGYQLQQVSMMPQQQPQQLQLQHQQHYVPVMDFHHQYAHQGAPMLVQVPVGPPAPSFSSPQSMAYSVPVPMVTTSSDAFGGGGPYYATATAASQPPSAGAGPDPSYYTGETTLVED